MATLVYTLCAITTILCALLLGNAFRKSGSRILLWSTLCFVGLALNNIVLVIDLVVFPKALDLSMLRSSLAVAGVGALIYGLIFDIN